MVYVVPHEVLDGQAQGGLCSFPIDRLPTGIHRGRFHPKTKNLFAAGMFAWAGVNEKMVGFTESVKWRTPLTCQPSWRSETKSFGYGSVTNFQSGSFAVSTWSLKRTRSYGSKYYDTKKLDITNYKLQEDWLELEVPDLEPTWCMEISCKFRKRYQSGHTQQYSSGEVRTFHEA